MKTFIQLVLVFIFVHPSILHAQMTEPENLIIDDIQCLGNENTNCEILQREIYLNPGDKVNDEELKNAKLRIHLLGFFDQVDLYLQKSSERGHVIVVINVVEANPIYTKFGERLVGSVNYSQLTSIGVGNRNLFGTGKSLLATFEYFNAPNDFNVSRLTLDFIDPHFLGEKKIYLSGNVFIESFKGSINSNSFKFLGYIGYRIFDLSHVSVGIASEKHKSDDNSYSINYENYLLNYGWSTLDDLTFPKEGNSFDLTFTRSFDRIKFYEDNLELDYKKYYPINAKNILSSEFKFFHYLNWEGYSLSGQWDYYLDQSNINVDNTIISKLYIKPTYAFKIYPMNIIECGYVLDSKKWGLINLSLTYARTL